MTRPVSGFWKPFRIFCLLATRTLDILPTCHIYYRLFIHCPRPLFDNLYLESRLPHSFHRTAHSWPRPLQSRPFYRIRDIAYSTFRPASLTPSSAHPTDSPSYSTHILAQSTYGPAYTIHSTVPIHKSCSLNSWHRKPFSWPRLYHFQFYWPNSWNRFPGSAHITSSSAHWIAPPTPLLVPPILLMGVGKLQSRNVKGI